MPKRKIAITLEAHLVEEVDRLVAARRFANRSQGIESAVVEKLQSLEPAASVADFLGESLRPPRPSGR